MKLLIAGATGFIGQELVKALISEHDITVLGRDVHHIKAVFPQKIIACSWDKLNTLDAKTYGAIINLAGHNISSGRWTEKTKQKIINSRVDTTTTLINWANHQDAKPHLYCANAVGIYGTQKQNSSEILTEDSEINFKSPDDFLSLVGVRWEEAAKRAQAYGMDVTIPRFGVVLKKDQGMLKKLAPSFNFYMGSIIGDGQQMISWVHIDDVIGGLLFLLDHPQLTGAFNLTSPHPVSQKEFAKTLAQTMNRPLFLKTPKALIRLLFGEMGEALINHGQAVAAKRLTEAGYQFKYPQLKAALEQEFK